MIMRIQCEKVVLFYLGAPFVLFFESHTNIKTKKQATGKKNDKSEISSSFVSGVPRRPEQRLP